MYYIDGTERIWKLDANCTLCRHLQYTAVEDDLSGLQPGMHAVYNI